MKNIEILTLDEKCLSDFSEARNKLLKKAKSRWVLFIDSDEIVPKELEAEILHLDPNGYKGFFIKRKIIFLGKEIGEDNVLRLGKNNAGKWRRAVHETWEIKGKIGTLNNYIIHNTVDDLHQYIKKINYYTDIHAKENLKEGKRSNLVKIVLFPKLKFIHNILIGRGFVFSVLQSFHSFLGWSKQWELQKK